MQILNIPIKLCPVAGQSGRNNNRFALYLDSCLGILHIYNEQKIIFYSHFKKAELCIPINVVFRHTIEKIIIDTLSPLGN